MLSEHKISGVTPNSQLIDSLSECDFALSSCCEGFDLLLFLHKQLIGTQNVAEGKILDSDITSQLQDVEQSLPMFFLESFTNDELKYGPDLLVEIHLTHQVQPTSVSVGSLDLILPLKSEILEVENLGSE